jgi:hypothetical protein
MDRAGLVPGNTHHVEVAVLIQVDRLGPEVAFLTSVYQVRFESTAVRVLPHDYSQFAAMLTGHEVRIAIAIEVSDVEAVRRALTHHVVDLPVALLRI